MFKISSSVLYCLPVPWFLRSRLWNWVLMTVMTSWDSSLQMGKGKKGEEEHLWEDHCSNLILSLKKSSQRNFLETWRRRCEDQASFQSVEMHLYSLCFSFLHWNFPLASAVWPGVISIHFKKPFLIFLCSHLTVLHMATWQLLLGARHCPWRKIPGQNKC